MIRKKEVKTNQKLHATIGKRPAPFPSPPAILHRGRRGANAAAVAATVRFHSKPTHPPTRPPARRTPPPATAAFFHSSGWFQLPKAQADHNSTPHQ